MNQPFNNNNKNNINNDNCDKYLIFRKEEPQKQEERPQ